MGDVIVSGMDIRHGLPYAVEQLLAEHATRINLSILKNKRVYSEVLAQLRVRMCAWEKHIHMQWEQIEKHWRTVNNRHAIENFKRTLASVSYRNPPQRRVVFDDLCVEQRNMHAQLLDNLHTVYKLVPPTLTIQSVEEWKHAVDDVLSQTARTHKVLTAALRSQEVQLHTECCIVLSGSSVVVAGGGGLGSDGW